MKDLASVSATERDEFINSVDNVICDIDGVLWVSGQPIAGAARCIDHFRAIGKQVIFVTNNTTSGISTLKMWLKDAGMGINPIVISPISILIYYLKMINFHKAIYVVSSPCVKKALKEAGIEYIEDKSDPLDMGSCDFSTFLADDHRIGAVFVDWEMNVNFIKMQKAVMYLGRPEVLFLEGATDYSLACGNNLTIIGARYFQKPIEELTRRKPIPLSKPSLALKDYIRDELNIQDFARTLLIGDTIEQDMRFGALSGYRKLLVLSGNAKKNDILNWKHDESCKPDYYIDNMGVLYDLLAHKA